MILKDLHGSVGARAGVQEPMPTLNPKGCVGLRGLLHSIQPSSRVCGAKRVAEKVQVSTRHGASTDEARPT